MTDSLLRTCPLCKLETARYHEFCERCGRPIGHFCVECGAERSTQGNFCVKCGHEFKPLPPPPREKQPGQESSTPAAPLVTPLFPVWFKRLILGAVLVFVLAGLGLAVTLWLRRQWSEVESAQPPAAPAASHATGQVEVVSDAEPIALPDAIPIFSKDARWQARFEFWYVKSLPHFKPLPPGSPLEVEMRSGQRLSGTLQALSNRLVTLSRDGMAVGIDPAQLTLRTLSQLYREAYAQEQAALAVEREQQAEGIARALQSDAGTRTAQRPTAGQPSGKIGPPTTTAPVTEFQADLAVFKQWILRLAVGLLIIVGVIVVIRHIW